MTELRPAPTDPRPDPSDALIDVFRNELRVVLSIYNPTKQEYVPYKEWPCAVGQEAYRTPLGRFRVVSTSRRPSWTLPNSDWVRKAGLKPGTVVPAGDPNNPIKGRWIGFCLAVGIHGTADVLSLGHAASHGCVRMRVEDVIELYPHAEVGKTVVLVHGKQPAP
jgi:lipoprotein-anchoring transpeptidase ErfK/SrfK